MASPYSDDLRRKFLEAYQRGEGSLPALAGRFGVSLGWAEKIWRALRETGRTERAAGGRRGPASKVTTEIQQQLHRWVQAQPDLTLVELQRRLWEERELEISVSRLWTVLRELGLYLKKSRSTPPNRTPKPRASGAVCGVKKPTRSIRRS